MSIHDCKKQTDKRKTYINALICPDCQMDCMWPSWCKCKPQRCYTGNDIVQAGITPK